jgi:hypothetical protein
VPLGSSPPRARSQMCPRTWARSRGRTSLEIRLGARARPARWTKVPWTDKARGRAGEGMKRRGWRIPPSFPQRTVPNTHTSTQAESTTSPATARMCAHGEHASAHMHTHANTYPCTHTLHAPHANTPTHAPTRKRRKKTTQEIHKQGGLPRATHRCPARDQ